jgi:hypothetical protein
MLPSHRGSCAGWILVIGLVLVIVTGAQRCTYTAAGWANRTSLLSSGGNESTTTTDNEEEENAVDTLCGVPWGPLLRKQPTRLIVSENVPWLLGAQTYISAALNWRRFAGVETLALHVDGGDNLTIDMALWLMGDSLERVCDDVGQWSLADDAMITHAMRLLDALNHGRLPDAPSCGDEFSAITVDWALATHYYINGNDVIVVRDPSTNLTQRQSLLEGTYATQYGLYTLCAVLFLTCLAMGVKLVLVLREQHHQYHAFNKRDPDVDFELDVVGSTGGVAAADDDSSSL